MSQRLRIRSDDEWWHVKSKWLGPRDFPFPTWLQFRYPAWVLMPLVIFATLGIDYMLGLLAWAVWTLIPGVWAAAMLLRFSDDEMNVRQLLALIWHERGLPREPVRLDRPQRLEFRRENP
jgi:hypothetical protein